MSVNLTNEVLAENYRWVLPWWILNSNSHYADRRQQTSCYVWSACYPVCVYWCWSVLVFRNWTLNCHFGVFETSMKWHTILGRLSPMVCAYVKILPKKSMHFVEKTLPNFTRSGAVCRMSTHLFSMYMSWTRLQHSGKRWYEPVNSEKIFATFLLVFKYTELLFQLTHKNIFICFSMMNESLMDLEWQGGE